MDGSGSGEKEDKLNPCVESANKGKSKKQVRLQRLILAAGLVIFVALAASLPAQTGGAAQNVANDAQLTAVPGGKPAYGISFINSAELHADEQQLANGAAAGAGWDRWPFYWFYIEKSHGVFDWSRQDTAVKANLTRGLQINAILLGTPGFYTTSLLKATDLPFRHPQRMGTLSLQSVEKATPLGLHEPVFTDGDSPGASKVINPNNKWAVFVAAAVNRYKPGGVLAHANGWPQGVGVTVWEMWNEPDLPFFWDAGLTDYARLLKVGYLAAKHVDPNATVMFGGLAMWQYPDYYERVLDVYDGDSLAVSQSFFHDIMAIHNYTKPERSSEYVKVVRQAMSAHGLDKAIWLNESGVPAWDDYPGPTWEPLSALRSTQLEQAHFTIQSAFYALSAGADALFYFQLYDGCGNQPAGTDFPPHNGELCDANNNYNGKPCAGDAYGLFRNPTDAACFTQHPQPETPRPSFAAYQVLTTHVIDVEPYWREREGAPIHSSTCPYSDGTQEWIALYQPATKKRIVSMWARCERDETAVIKATDPNGIAKLVAPDGTVQQIRAYGGHYSISLPKATHRNPDPGQSNSPVYPIGGRPAILIETDYKGQAPTPTATAGPADTATPTETTTPETTATPPAGGIYLFYAPTFFNDYPLGIKGQITDAGGSAISGVVVKTDRGNTTTSDDNGRYGFSHLDPGVYILRPEKAGYVFQPQTRQVTLPPAAVQQNFVAVPPTATPGPYPGSD